MNRTAEIVSIEPVVVRRQIGGYLAVSPDDAPLHIGVEGVDETEARENYRRALAAWGALASAA
jgi:hypothetical protein